MNHLSRQLDRHTSHSRAGFTLVELLVAISIFVILLSLTAGMVFVTRDGDRIAASARVVQAFLEGGRVRSFKMKELKKDSEEDIISVGVRLYRDPADWTIVSSMAYVTQIKDRGTLRIAPSDTATDKKHVQWQNTGLPSDKRIGVAWSTLDDRDYLLPGSSIRIATNSSSTSFENFNIISAENLASDYSTLVAINELEIYPPSPNLTAGQFLSYELTLLPSLMADSQPVQLPRGTVIDLLSSSRHLPSSWNIPTSYNFWAASTAYSAGDIVFPTGDRTHFFIAANTGMSGSSQPGWNRTLGQTTAGTGSGSDQITWITPGEYHDLMFSSQGTVVGAEAVKGVVRFVLALKRDTDLGLTIDDLFYNPNDDGPATSSSTDNRPRGEMRVVSFFTQSGMVLISPVDPTPRATPDDYLTLDPFSFAKSGEESK